MPYLITTRTPAATLYEAQDAVIDRLQVEAGAPPIRSRDEYERLIDQAMAIESGGTVGPLPDGTVIEVERIA